MSSNTYDKVGLYEHNADSYDKVKESFSNGNSVVGIVHATGTGKSYNALQLAYDNKDEHVVYVVPSNGIIEHIKKIIEDNPNLDLKNDFPNLEFRTYQSFINLSEEEISEINCDLLILDEFHHIGAPVWGARINTMIDTHPEMRVFGMTAYTVRDRGTSYERDMANAEGEEVFSNKIVSRYDLCDAMIDGVLPKPIYKTAYTNLIGMERQLQEKVEKLDATSKDYQELSTILNQVKKKIHEAPSIPKLLKKNIKPNGKYIYFCPPCSEEGTNDIETIKKEAYGWFKEFVSEEDIVFYQSTSDMGSDGKKNRDAFYDDFTLDGESAENKLRIMFAINQYNEGIHAPNIDGVIMGRGTTSDIVYFEQLGRALSVRDNTKENFDKLENCSIEQLINICKKRDIIVTNDMSKNDIIEKILAPTIIDLTNNFDFIKDLENNLRDRVRLYQSKGLGNKKLTEISDVSFDIDIVDKDLYDMLSYALNRLTMTWMDKYNLAKAYYEHHGNLEIPQHYKTLNGYDYDENGINLGNWIYEQRRAFKAIPKKLTQEQINLLKQIGMRFDKIDNMSIWMDKYYLAKEYFAHHGDLEVPINFKTLNGYDYDENGINLGNWMHAQRYVFKAMPQKLTQEQINLLKQIGMRFDNIDTMSIWIKKYNLAKEFYKHHGDLKIPFGFRTVNGYDYDENGMNLSLWITNQREAYKGRKGKITQKQIDLLRQIGMRFDNIDNMSIWMDKYYLAKEYFAHHGDLEVPINFKTLNGYDYDENGINLANWIYVQRKAFKAIPQKLTQEQINLLNQIGMRFDNVDIMSNWMEKYNLAKKYYEHHGNLEIPLRFKSINGYEPDENGVNLGQWLQGQRQAYVGKKDRKLTQEQIDLLNSIGIVWMNDSIDVDKQQEIINIDNKKRKLIEIRNRAISLLSQFDQNTLPSKEEMNNEFIDQLNKPFKK